MKGGVARASLQRLAEQSESAGVVSLIERGQGLWCRQILARGQSRAEQGHQESATEKESKRAVPASHDAARGKEHSVRFCGTNRDALMTPDYKCRAAAADPECSSPEQLRPHSLRSAHPIV